MEAIGALVWNALTAVGGTLALSLIIAIGVGISALTLLFFGSAVVALEQFARVRRRLAPLLVLSTSFAALAGYVVVQTSAPELAVAGWSDFLAGYFPIVGGCALAIGLAVLIVAFALARLTSETLAVVTMAWLGLGFALVVGAAGQVVYALAPLVAVLALSSALALRRRRANGAPRAASRSERSLRTLAAALAVGVVVAVAFQVPNADIADAGSALLAGFGWLTLLGLVPLAAAGLYELHGSVEWFIAIRYLVAKRRQTFISVITGICVVGIAAGVWLIITVLSVMNGFERTWREEIIGNRAHFTVHSRLGPFDEYQEVLERVDAMPEVLGASPFIDADGMVRGNTGEIMAVRLRGIDPARVGRVTDLRDDMVAGSVDSLDPAETAEGDPPAILIGSRLARTVGADIGDDLLLVSPFGGPQTPLGPAPRLARFRVTGIFESSFFQYDEIYTFVNLEAAQGFRRDPDVIDGIEARTTDFYRSRPVGAMVEQELGFPFYTRDWKEFFPAFFQALKSERVMMFMLLAMIFVVAAFSIVSTLVMMIMEKSSDIAILKAMGAENSSIERIFAIEGTLIGLVGTAIGVVAAISVTTRIGWVQAQIENFLGFDALPASVYQFSTLPSELDAVQVALAVGLAMVFSLGATLLPSRQAAKIDPVEALRYE